MAVKFVLLVNKQGQTRLAKYTDQSMTVEERRALEGEIVRRCLARAEKQVLVADQTFSTTSSRLVTTAHPCSVPSLSTATTRLSIGAMPPSSSWWE